MRLEINLSPKDRGQFLVPTRTLHTEEVLRLKVLPQKTVVLVELLFPVAFAEVAPKVMFPQVRVKSIVVQETLVAETAHRMSPIGGLTGVPLPAVLGELLTSVQLEL